MRPTSPYNFQMLADDLAGLMDVTGIKAAHICGESFGGYIAQYFILSYPEKVINLILRCTSCGGPHSAPRDAEYLKLVTDPKLSKKSPEEISRLLMPNMFARAYAEKNPRVIAKFSNHKLKYPNSPQVMMRLRQVAATQDIYERLPEISVPTLVIHGDADRIITVENARILASRIAKAELEIFKGPGHLLVEAGDEPNRRVLEFLKKHPSTGSG